MTGHAEAMEDLKHLLTAREPYYRKADAVLNTSGQNTREEFASLRHLVRDQC